MSCKLVLCLLVFVVVAKCNTLPRYRPTPYGPQLIRSETINDEDVLEDVVFDEDEDEDTALRVAVKDVCLHKCIQAAKMSAKECNRECIKAIKSLPKPRFIPTSLINALRRG